MAGWKTHHFGSCNLMYFPGRTNMEKTHVLLNSMLLVLDFVRLTLCCGYLFSKKSTCFKFPLLLRWGNGSPLDSWSTSIWRSQELLDDLDTAQGFFHQAILPKMRQALPNNERQGATATWKGHVWTACFFCDLKGKVTWKDSTWKWSENGWREKRSLSERLPGRCINFFGGFYVMFNLGSVHQEGWGNWSYWWFEWMRAGPARFRVFELLLGRPYSCGDEEEDDEN